MRFRTSFCVRVAIEPILPRTYHPPVRVALATALLLFLSGTATATGAFVQFRTPSANIGCAYSSGSGTPSLRCDILSGLKPHPAEPSDCNLDWGFGFSMGPTGRPRNVCASDTAVD